MNDKYNRYLVCDDLLSDGFIDNLRKKMDSDRDAVLKLLYQQELIEHKGKPYQCICHSLDVGFGRIIDLELSVTQTGRILKKPTYKNKFKKTYKNYGDFLEEWEEIV